jgi:hypothetical protein
MGDYVLESNPALGRLIERLATQGGPPAHEQSSLLSDSTRNRRRRHAKVSRRVRENPTIVVDKRPAKNPSVAEPAGFAHAVAVEHNLWANHEDSRADEIVLVDFDEEPAVFADEDDGDDTFAGDEADEILDVYGEDLDAWGEPAYGDAEAIDERSVQTVSAVENEQGDWIIDAFKAWMLEAPEASW